MNKDTPAGILDHLALVAERRDALRHLLVPILSDHRELVWEVGCGHGHFLTAYAAENPQTLCIGVDVAKDRIERARRKQKRARLANLHFVHAEAADFLAALPQAVRFTAVFVLFPDPWPKRRHHKNRVWQPEFLSDLAARMEPGAQIYFRSDHVAYQQYAKSVLQSHPDWKHDQVAPWPLHEPTIFQQKAALFHSLIGHRR